MEATGFWQVDGDATSCPLCAVVFGFFVRKHHCRRCGYIFCEDCAPHREDEGMGKFAHDRICHTCFDIIKGAPQQEKQRRVAPSVLRAEARAAEEKASEGKQASVPPTPSSTSSSHGPAASKVVAGALDSEGTRIETRLLDVDDPDDASSISNGVPTASHQLLIAHLAGQMQEYERTIKRLTATNAQLASQCANGSHTFGSGLPSLSSPLLSQTKGLPVLPIAKPLTSRKLVYPPKVVLERELLDNHANHMCSALFEVELSPEIQGKTMAAPASTPAAVAASLNTLHTLGIDFVRSPYFVGNRHRYGYIPPGETGGEAQTGGPRLAKLSADPTEGLSPLFPEQDIDVIAPFGVAVAGVRTSSGGSLCQKYNATIGKECVCQRVRPGLLLTHVNGQSMAGITPIGVLELLAKKSFPVTLSFMSHPLAMLTHENNTLQAKAQLYKMQIESCSAALSATARKASAAVAASNKKLRILSKAYTRIKDERDDARAKLQAKEALVVEMEATVADAKSKMQAMAAKTSSLAGRQFLMRQKGDNSSLPTSPRLVAGSRNLMAEMSGIIPQMSMMNLLSQGPVIVQEEGVFTEGQSHDQPSASPTPSPPSTPQGKGTSNSNPVPALPNGSGAQPSTLPTASHLTSTQADAEHVEDFLRARSILTAAMLAHDDAAHASHLSSEPTLMVALDPLYPDIKVPLRIGADGKPILPGSSPLYSVLTSQPDVYDSVALRQLVGYMKKLSKVSREVQTAVVGTFGPVLSADDASKRPAALRNKKKRQPTGPMRLNKKDKDYGADAMEVLRGEDGANRMDAQSHVQAFQVLHAYMQRDAAVRFAEEALCKFAELHAKNASVQSELTESQSMSAVKTEKIDMLETMLKEYHDQLQAAGISPAVLLPSPSVAFMSHSRLLAALAEESERGGEGEGEEKTGEDATTPGFGYKAAPTPTPRTGAASIRSTKSPSSRILQKFVTAAQMVGVGGRKDVGSFADAESDALALWQRYKSLHERATVLSASFDGKCLEYDRLRLRVNQLYLECKQSKDTSRALMKQLEETNTIAVRAKAAADDAAKKVEAAQLQVAALQAQASKAAKGKFGLIKSTKDKGAEDKSVKTDKPVPARSAQASSGDAAATKAAPLKAGEDVEGKGNDGEDSDDEPISELLSEVEALTGAAPGSLGPKPKEVAPVVDTPSPSPQSSPVGTPLSTPTGTGEGGKSASNRKKSFAIFRRHASSEEEDVDRVDTSVTIKDLLLDQAAGKLALDSTSSVCALSGDLYKRSRKGKGKWSPWEFRHIEFRSGFCMYFKSEFDKKPQNFFKLADVAVVRPLKPGITDKEFVVELELRFGKQYQFATADVSLRNTWCSVLSAIALANLDRAAEAGTPSTAATPSAGVTKAVGGAGSAATAVSPVSSLLPPPPPPPVAKTPTPPAPAGKPATPAAAPATTKAVPGKEPARATTVSTPVVAKKR